MPAARRPVKPKPTRPAATRSRPIKGADDRHELPARMATLQANKRSVPMIRTTERKDFKRCQQRWWWAWREGLVPDSKATPLWFGIGLHEALATYYRHPGTKRDVKGALDVWDKYTDLEFRRIRTLGLSGEEADERVAAKELGLAMLTGYHDLYKGDKHWHVIQPEKAFQIEVADDTGKVVAVYCGTYDLVYRDLRDNKIKLGEHKGYKAIVTDHLPLDEQVGSYLWVAPIELKVSGLIKPKDVIQEITYNILRKGLPDTTREKNRDGLYLNKDGSISKQQPAPLFHREPVRRTSGEQETQARRVLDEVAQMNAVRSGQFQPTKNPTRECAWDCAFFHLCQLHEANEDWEFYKQGVFTVEDPYADHRKSI
jgi:hypothetical protein